jgi:hypothetical protein
VPVNLPVASPSITKTGNTSGHAFLTMDWTGRAGCSHGSAEPAKLRIGLPINGSSLIAAAVALDGSRIEACQNSLSVHPFRADPVISPL